MSEEETQDIKAKYDTSPTIETLLTELRSFRVEVLKRFDNLEARVESIEIDLDKTRSVAYEMRGDVRELRRELREHFPAVK